MQGDSVEKFPSHFPFPATCDRRRCPGVEIALGASCRKGLYRSSSLWLTGKLKMAVVAMLLKRVIAGGIFRYARLLRVDLKVTGADGGCFKLSGVCKEF